jgi:hypothetical protein
MQHPRDTSWFLPDPSGGGPVEFDREDGSDHECGARRDFYDRQSQHQQPLPPRNSHPPPSGFRIPLASNAEFPPPEQVGPRACLDSNGVSSIYLASAILEDSVHPCKIAPSVHPPCRVSYDGGELHHHGRYDLLPITSDMEWVPTSDGEIPPGRRPIEGGYESNGEKLYHALGTIGGVDVPGKTGVHLVGRSSAFAIYSGLTIWNVDREARTSLTVIATTPSTNTRFCELWSTHGAFRTLGADLANM